MQGPLILELPGENSRTFAHLVLDFTGTLALDGVLLPGVAERLARVAETLYLTVLTADTFGTAIKQLEGIPVYVRIVQAGAEKAEVVSGFRSEGVIVIGNARNDVPMMKLADLGIAVIGQEGASSELVCAAQIVVHDINDALDLLLNPRRLKATLRS